MSDEQEKTDGEPTPKSDTREGLPAKERFDEDGLPLDRPATLDDVRGGAGSGRVIAVGCTIFVVIVLGLFWLIRGGLLG